MPDERGFVGEECITAATKRGGHRPPRFNDLVALHTADSAGRRPMTELSAPQTLSRSRAPVSLEG